MWQADWWLWLACSLVCRVCRRQAGGSLWQESRSREKSLEKWLICFTLGLENWICISLSLLDFQEFWNRILFLLSKFKIFKKNFSFSSRFMRFWRKKSLSLLDFQDLNRKKSLSPLDVWDFTHNFSFTSLESNSIFKKNVNFQIMYWKVPGKMLTLIFG